MKNGRRSEKNVSKADRLTTAGSASTCPKSGFTVPVNVKPVVRPYFTSSPNAPSGVDGLTSGLPLAGWRVSCDTMYGSSSSRLGVVRLDNPARSPNDDTNPVAARGNSGHVDVSL